jgi:hypothetical protein
MKTSIQWRTASWSRRNTGSSEDKMRLVFDMKMRKEAEIAKDSISFLIVPTSQLPVNTRIWSSSGIALRFHM